MNNLKKNHNGLSMSKIKNAFVQKPEAFLADTISEVFENSQTDTGNIPCIINEIKLKLLHTYDMGLITFNRQPNSVAIKNMKINYSNSQVCSTGLLKQLTETNFWAEEIPRSGICLISKKCIPDSQHRNFLDQSRVLLNYLVEVFPEIKKTEFYNSASTELNIQHQFILNLIKSGNYKEAISILKNLKVNKYFRPRLCELFQYCLLYKLIFKIDLYKNEYSWTNSQSQSKEELINFCSHEESGFGIYGAEPDVAKFATIGSSFIISLDWLSEIL